MRLGLRRAAAALVNAAVLYPASSALRQPLSSARARSALSCVCWIWRGHSPSGFPAMEEFGEWLPLNAHRSFSRVCSTHWRGCVVELACQDAWAKMEVWQGRGDPDAEGQDNKHLERPPGAFVNVSFFKACQGHRQRSCSPIPDACAQRMAQMLHIKCCTTHGSNVEPRQGLRPACHKRARPTPAPHSDDISQPIKRHQEDTPGIGAQRICLPGCRCC